MEINPEGELFVDGGLVEWVGGIDDSELVQPMALQEAYYSDYPPSGYRASDFSKFIRTAKDTLAFEKAISTMGEVAFIAAVGYLLAHCGIAFLVTHSGAITTMIGATYTYLSKYQTNIVVAIVDEYQHPKGFNLGPGLAAKKLIVRSYADRNATALAGTKTKYHIFTY